MPSVTPSPLRAVRREKGPGTKRRRRCRRWPPELARVRDDARSPREELRRVLTISASKAVLLDLDGAAGVGDLLLDLRRLVLGDVLLDGLVAGLDQVLGLLEAEAREGADFLDDRYLLVGRDAALEDDGELGLLLDCGGGGAGGGGGTGAAAVTPNFSSIALMRSAISMIFISAMASRICSFVNAAILSSP